MTAFPTSSPLDGQVAWVTGGGSGIGLAGAVALAHAGCRVVVSGRDAAKLEAALAAAQRQGVAPERIAAEPLDVADADAVARVAGRIEARLGAVDILVNSAGVNVPRRRWDETDAPTFDGVVAINLHGATYCMLAVVAGMRARGRGTVINVASFVGWHLGRLTGPAYTASKAGLVALTKTFNIEQGAHGLRATALCPGEVATPILRSRPVPPSEAEQARMLQEGDLGRIVRFVAELPPRVCIDELVVSPVPNRLWDGREG